MEGYVENTMPPAAYKMGSRGMKNISYRQRDGQMNRKTTHDNN